MNMISTGSFLTEMDASNKQETLAEKFAAVWEKKNSKAARAGGVSLMALSLAACGSSSNDDTAAAPTTPATPATPTTPVVTPVSAALTAAQNILTNLTTANDTITATQATIGATDVIVDDNSTDSDTLTVTSDGTAINLGTVVGIENIVVNVTDFGAAGAITATNVASGTLTVNNLQNAGTTGVDVNDAASITVAAGTGVTGTIDVAMVADAATVVRTGTATAAIIDAAGTVADQTITVVTAGNVNITSTDAETLNVSGTGNVTLNANTDDLDGTAATITGSAGQTLIAADSNDIDGATITGFDTVQIDTTVANTSFDARGISGSVHATATAASTDVVVLASGGRLILDADVSATVDIDDGSATTTTTTGVANVTLAEASAAGGTTIVVNAAGDRVSTLNITAAANQTVGDLTITASTATAVTLAGAGNVDLVTSGFSSAASTLNATNLSGDLTATVDAQLLTITGGSGDDTITNLTDVASILDGGAGVDTFATAALNNKTTLSNFEVIAIAGEASSDFDASQLSGKTYAVTGTTDIEINATSSIDLATIDLSTLRIETATVDVIVDLTAIDGTVLLAATEFTYIGSSAADTVTGSANDDNISGNGGIDTITAGAGDDVINGGAGNDELEGEAGADTYTTGTGSDDILIDTVAHSAAAVTGTAVTFDSVTDFTTTEDEFDVAVVADLLAAGNATGVTVTAITTGSTSLNDTTIADFAELKVAIDALGLVASAAGAAGGATGLQAYTIDLSGNTGALGTGKYLLLNNNDTAITAADVMIALDADATVVAGDFII